MKENQIESYQKCLLIKTLKKKKKARHSVLKIDVCTTLSAKSFYHDQNVL